MDNERIRRRLDEVKASMNLDFQRVENILRSKAGALRGNQDDDEKYIAVLECLVSLAHYADALREYHAAKDTLEFALKAMEAQDGG